MPTIGFTLEGMPGAIQDYQPRQEPQGRPQRSNGRHEDLPSRYAFTQGTSNIHRREHTDPRTIASASRSSFPNIHHSARTSFSASSGQRYPQQRGDTTAGPPSHGLSPLRGREELLEASRHHSAYGNILNDMEDFLRDRARRTGISVMSVEEFGAMLDPYIVEVAEQGYRAGLELGRRLGYDAGYAHRMHRGYADGFKNSYSSSAGSDWTEP